MHALLHVGRRAGQIAITVLLVALLTFTLLHMLPGDPAVVLLGERATEATIAQLHHQMGLDQPIPVPGFVSTTEVPVNPLQMTMTLLVLVVPVLVKL